MGTHEHKAAALRHLRVAILTVSTTRSIKEDKSGQWMARRAAREGHQVVDHRITCQPCRRTQKLGNHNHRQNMTRRSNIFLFSLNRIFHSEGR